MSYIIRAAVPSDANLIAPLLREADKNEITAMVAMDPALAITISISESDEAWLVCRPDGQPILISGVGSDPDGDGVPWMVGTPLVADYGKSLVKVGRRFVQRWTDRYGYLFNYMDARNEVHMDWLTRMGFTVQLASHYIGHDPSVPFLFFYRSNSCA